MDTSYLYIFFLKKKKHNKKSCILLVREEEKKNGATVPKKHITKVRNCEDAWLSKIIACVREFEK